jgi:hypothetical protein
MQQEPEWKRKARMSSQACLAKLSDLKQRGVEDSESKSVYKAPPTIYGQGTYHCPVCDALTNFHRFGSFSGGAVHTCSNPDCDWYWYTPVLLD